MLNRQAEQDFYCTGATESFLIHTVTDYNQKNTTVSESLHTFIILTPTTTTTSLIYLFIYWIADDGGERQLTRHSKILC